jgi:zinc protease
MIDYQKTTLDNGLTVLLHQDKSTPLVVVNTLYDVGARDENEDKTGFAHLFEHLMFGGSAHIPDFDGPLQNAGGDSNAFTSNDVTNYYNTLPKENLETALWLESDRMLQLAFTHKSLEVQRSVVIEEFKQRYLNQPYGKVWLELRPLAYKVHPYKWATIGKAIKPIEDATMEDVKAFFSKHYGPKNAVLCVAGNIDFDETLNLIRKHYDSIPAGTKYFRDLSEEPKQNEFRELTITDDVPANAFYYSFKMCERLNDDYLVTDVLSDILGRDKSSQLYTQLKKQENLVTEISAYITGSADAGLFMISGKLANGVTFDQLDESLWKCLADILATEISESDKNKTLNKIRTAKEFQDQGVLNRAMNLCFYELMGDLPRINQEMDRYKAITTLDLHRVANEILQKQNCSLLRVESKPSES